MWRWGYRNRERQEVDEHPLRREHKVGVPGDGGVLVPSGMAADSPTSRLHGGPSPIGPSALHAPLGLLGAPIALLGLNVRPVTIHPCADVAPRPLPLWGTGPDLARVLGSLPHPGSLGVKKIGAYLQRPSYEATHALRVSHPGLSR